jgi:hypothetical protein
MRRLPVSGRALALLLLVGPAWALGCRGAEERLYDDGTEDGSPEDGAALLDATSGDAPSKTDGQVSDDGEVAPDTTTEDAPETDGGSDVIVTADSGDATVVDAPSDAKDASDANVDANDGGCGATNTAQNCGACGVACDPDSGTSTIQACAVTTCVYTCRSGRVDCNAAAPNTNGCECAGNGCCGGGAKCQTQHSTGVGTPFFDCIDAGTYNQTQATAACNAFVADGGAGPCTPFDCAANAGKLICNNGGAGPCNCWKYDPGNSGVNGKVSTSCLCPVSASAIDWN